MRLSLPICKMGRLYKGTVRIDKGTKDSGHKTPQKTQLESGLCCEDFQRFSTTYGGCHSKRFLHFSRFNSTPPLGHQHYFYYHFISEEAGALEMQ